MYVILTEKPSASKNFAKAFGGMNGTYQGQPYVIVNALGHLLELKEPHEQVDDDYVDEFKSWNPKDMPWDIKQMNWQKRPIVRQNRGKKESLQPLINDIKKAVDKSTAVVIATDVDPSGEGQLLAWEVLQAIGYKGPVKRLYFDDEEASSLQKAWAKMKDLPSDPEKDGEYLKADVRSKWDFISMQLTRLTTTLARDAGYSTVVRQGRLKSVIVKLVADQEAARKHYVRKPYYEVKYEDEFGHKFARKLGKDDDTDGIRFDSEADATKDGKNFTDPGTPVQDSVTQRKSAPGKLLDLQGITGILAPRGFKPDEVIATYQKMYQDAIVSYPRTEDKFITPEQFKDLERDIDKIADVVGVDKSLLTHRQARKTHVKNGAAHGANRPGKKIPKSLASLKSYGRSAEAIYELLAKNSLAMFGEDYEFESVKAHIKEHPEFLTTFSIPLKQGFKEIFDTEKETNDDDESDESKDKLGTQAKIIIHEGANQKPARPTIKWLSRQLEKYDVGTGATRASTIPAVSNGKTALLDETKGVLSLTQTGEISAVFLEGSHIASPSVTEKLFKAMKNVGSLDLDPKVVLKTATDVIAHDKKVFMDNQKKLQKAIGKPKGALIGLPKKEKVSGTYTPTGESISFNVEYSGHKFTEKEVASLLKGETINVELTSKKGSEYTIDGKLELGEYKGHKFWGFRPDGDTRKFANSFPEKDKIEGAYKPTGEKVKFNREWGGHTFTDDEAEQLLDGDAIKFDAVSKSGKAYIAKGKLEEQSFKGNKFWGFKADFGKK